MAEKLSVENKINNRYLDLTKTGPLSYRELRQVIEGLPEESTLNSLIPDHLDTLNTLNRAGQVNVNRNAPQDYGNSSYDPGFASNYALEELNNIRGSSQSWFTQLLAGAAKGLVKIGTTFISGTAGLILGVGESLVQGNASRIWNNEINQWMQGVDDYMEQTLPNYYTDAERDDPWYKHIISGNFFGDKLIKNLGFSVGAFYSGKLWATPIQALMKGSKAARSVTSVAGATISAIGEGSIEAINNSRDWYKFMKQQLDDKYDQRIADKYDPLFADALKEYEETRGNLKKGLDGSMYDPAYAKYQATINALNESMQAEVRDKELNPDYAETLKKLEDRTLNMGTADFLMNIPILTFSNWVQFGRAYSSGFKNATKDVKINKLGMRYTPKHSGSTLGKYGAAVKGAVAEGTEEISQKAASETAGHYYATDVNNFYKSKFEPEAEQETLDWIKSASVGISKTLGESSSWEEFFIGALTGALGIPVFRSSRAADGSFQSPITLVGGARAHMREYMERYEEEKELADYMNSRVQSPKFLNYYRGLIRHRKYQNDMDEAAERGDAFDYKNAEYAQLVSDVIMFDNAGRLQDLRDMIDTALDTSDQNLKVIESITQSVSENGETVSPFIDKNGNSMSREDMVKKINGTKSEILKAIDTYQKTKEELNTTTREALSDDQLGELTWMKVQIDNWKERSSTMSGELKEGFEAFIGTLDSHKRYWQGIRNDEGEKSSELTDRYKKADEQINIIDRNIELLESVIKIMEASPESLSNILFKDPNLTNNLIEGIERADDGYMSADKKQVAITKLKDLVRLGEALNKYNQKFKEYLTNPEAQVSDQKATDREIIEQHQEEKNASLKDRLLQTNSVAEFRKALNEEEDEVTREKVLKGLIDEDNEIAKNYKDTSQYNAEVKKALNTQGLTDSELQDALALWEDQFNSAENLNQISNPNSSSINNPSRFDEDSNYDVDVSGSRFQKARYAIQEAMSKANEDIKFKNRFAPTVTPAPAPASVTPAPGNTRTNPPVASTTPSTETPVGDITSSEMAEENKNLNRTTQTPNNSNEGGKRQYYNPTVPEIHIEASKEGDFRPFDEIVKEREGSDYSLIYQYLKDNGAFDYINSGELKVGDSVGFMIDPEFEEKMKEKYDWYTGPTIFFVKGTQVLGDVASMSQSIKYEGLTELIQKVKDEYQTNENNSGEVTVKITTTPSGDDYLIFEDANGNRRGLDIDISIVPNNPYYDSMKDALSLKLIGIIKREDMYTCNVEVSGKDGSTTVVTYIANSNPLEEDSIKSQLGQLATSTSDNSFTFTETGSKGRTQTFTMKESSRTTDSRDGAVSIKFSGTRTDSAKPGEVRTLDNGFIPLDADSDLIDWAHYATVGAMDRNGKKLKPEDVEEQDIKDAKEQVEILATNQLTGKVRPLHITELIYTKDGEVYARTREIEGAIKLTGDPLKQSQAKTSSTGKFFATPKTKVSKIMVGKIPYTNEERSLKDIPGVVEEGKKPLFGIIRNGALVTNDKVSNSLIIKPVDMSNKEGRLYLLIPNAAGTYSPVAVRVKHFNTQEFNLDDATVSDTPTGRSINAALDALSKAESQDDVNSAVRLLSDEVYLGKGSPSEREINITWFDANAGSGIVISRKLKNPDGTYQKEVINGTEQIKEEKHPIYFQSSKKSITVGGLTFSKEMAGLSVRNGTQPASILSQFGEPKDISDIRKEVLNVLTGFNLPLQINARKINESGYNEGLINSNVLTSNLREAKVVSSWFTTDYFDNSGNLQKAINPVYTAPSPTVTPGRRVTTPVGGTESVIPGTKVTIGSSTYTVDLKTNIYTDSTGAKYSATTSNMNIFEMAWAQENFGDNTESSIMTENKIITPSHRVLDRNTGRYLNYEESIRVLNKLAGKNLEASEKTELADKVIEEIKANQAKVDKARTDKDYYYILEEDGEYHKYSRVHSRIGNNWVSSDESTNTNSSRALSSGSSVDSIIRDFFNLNKIPAKPDNMSQHAFNSLIDSLVELRARMATSGERFLTNNIVVFQKYPDGSRIAGELDILAVDKEGNFKIYDVKTSKYSFHEFTDKYGHKQNYFENVSPRQIRSTKEQYTLQLSAYKNLFESQYGTPITQLGIMPFVLDYASDNTISQIKKEKGIIITYNPSVNVPLVAKVRQSESNTSLPIFDNFIETMNPENRVLPENAFEEGGETGFYEKDGQLYSGYLKKIGEIEGIPIHVTKVRDKGFGRPGELGSTSEYLTVFPNGFAISTGTNSTSDAEAANVILEALSKNPDKVKSLSSQSTQLQSKPSETPASNGGASEMTQRESSINKKSAKRARHKLRVTDSARPVWNKQKEMEWLDKNLPQFSKQQRIRIVNGLIQVAEGGPKAWGMFSQGIITLSDVAAEGTTYHEAFHAVFSLGMSIEDRANLMEEARTIFGNKSYDFLEEDLAEAFREYVVSQEDRGLGRRILDFFRNLFDKVTNWKYVKPTMDNYFRMINQGRYRKMSLETTSNTRLRTEEYTPEMQSIKDKAVADGTFMKAPNGNPTNLNERQWLQVRTKAFKNWFGDWENSPSKASKVVDENGEPLVVYHGGSNTKIFDTSGNRRGGAGIKKGIKGTYFTTSETNANTYEEIYNFKTSEAWIAYADQLREEGASEEEIKFLNKTWENERPNTRAFFLNIKNPIETYYLGDNKKGYTENSNTPINSDGQHIRIENRNYEEYVAVNPNQIKSATDNIGEFSTENNDIRYRKVDSVIQEFEEAKAKVRELNNRRFNTEAEAKKAFENSGINKDFLYRITKSEVNNAIGHKIQLLTKEQFNNYKKIIGEKTSRKARESIENLFFERLNPDIQMELLNKGWTQEEFDSISQAERDNVIECMGL